MSLNLNFPTFVINCQSKVIDLDTLCKSAITRKFWYVKTPNQAGDFNQTIIIRRLN